ncbi:hypothetical protein BH24CHL3_BH24CHL3_02250 [soil metagenome]|jgi:hypothetical protein
MPGKTPAKFSTTWKPGDPLKFDKAIQNQPPNSPIADKLERVDDALFSKVNNANRSIQPTNHKPFNRQKKG